APPATAAHSGEFPGTLDPATKIFTPLGPGAAAPAPRVRGTLGLTVVIIGVDNDFGTPFTLLIHWICEFGRVVVPRDVVNGKVVNQIFVPDYTAQASTNFGAGDPVPEVTIPYDYTPTGPNPM